MRIVLNIMQLPQKMMIFSEILREGEVDKKEQISRIIYKLKLKIIRRDSVKEILTLMLLIPGEGISNEVISWYYINT